MNNGEALVSDVSDPNQLVELCPSMIDGLDTSSEEVAVAEHGVQLRAIAKAIEQLGRFGFSIPETLRAEKTRYPVARVDQRASLSEGRKIGAVPNARGRRVATGFAGWYLGAGRG